MLGPGQIAEIYGFFYLRIQGLQGTFRVLIKGPGFPRGVNHRFIDLAGALMQPQGLLIQTFGRGNFFETDFVSVFAAFVNAQRFGVQFFCQVFEAPGLLIGTLKLVVKMHQLLDGGRWHTFYYY